MTARIRSSIASGTYGRSPIQVLPDGLAQWPGAFGPVGDHRGGEGLGGAVSTEEGHSGVVALEEDLVGVCVQVEAEAVAPRFLGPVRVGAHHARERRRAHDASGEDRLPERMEVRDRGVESTIPVPADGQVEDVGPQALGA